MKKKIIFVSIFVILLLLGASIVSVVGSQNVDKKRESPLFSIRYKNMEDGNPEKIQNIVRIFFVGERLFPRLFFRNSKEFSENNNILIRDLIVRKCGITWYGVPTSCWIGN